MKNPHILTQVMIFILICVDLFTHFHQATPAAPGGPVQPQAPTALEAAAVQYRDRFGPSMAGLAGLVRRGERITKQEAVEYLAAQRKPLGDALNAAFDAHCDKDGNITDAAGLAADLDRPAKALGAK